MTRHLLGWVLFALPLTACAHVDAARDDALAQLRQEVADRTEASIPDRGDARERVVADAVTALLAGDLTEENAVRVALLNNRDVRAVYERLCQCLAGDVLFE